MKEQKEDIAEFMASFKTKSSDYLALYDIIVVNILFLQKNSIIPTL